MLIRRVRLHRQNRGQSLGQNQNRLAKILSVVVAAVMLFAPSAYADINSQISSLSAQIGTEQSQASQLHDQANTLQNQVSILDNQITSINNQIALNNLKAEQLNQQISANQQQLATQKSILDENIRTIYQESQVTPLEMLASSKNFSDYVDRQQYLDQIKDHIQQEMAGIQQIQASLQQQQIALNATLASQNAQESSLAAIQSQQNALLAETQGQESAYQQLVQSDQSKLQGLYAQRAALDAKNGVTTVSGGGGGGYPWANACTSFTPNCVDPYGYYYRQCVSFAAWYRIAYKDGQYMPYGWGNAGNWVEHAPSDRNPSVGAIAVFPPYGASGAGSVGHVAIVIGVGSGTIDVAEYNWQPYSYDTRYNVPVSDISFIH